PVEASTRFLRHMVDAWNYKMAAKHPEDRLEKQDVVLTVPASFDDMARTLTVEAARKAGLENLTLLEEPQAAFYCWLATHPPAEAGRLKPGSLCLVIDVGGGNMDLALAKAVETRLPGAGRLDATQYAMLTQACRQAKEVLLGPNPPA